MTRLDDTVTAEKTATREAWTFTLKALNLTARLGNWEARTTDTGLILSAPVSGSDAVTAVRDFAATSHIAGVCGDFQRAQLDYQVPGRVAAVWQSNGVWLELWTPDTEPGPPAPVQTVPKAFRRWRAGRLPNTRRRKENTTP
ncbi:hypothetical protein [Streptomyces sp. NPDC008092]|uniref:hypothetical protein n=1 Tax=Streptomyces sp. NPDC008092 TaxID=3364808 RepID=UPI0036E9D21E